MKIIDVGIGEFYASREIDEEIKTYALGSCVALVVWDQKVQVGGLIHMALPESQINPKRAAEQVGYFVDSGIPAFLEALRKLGANRKTSRLKLLGGAKILDEKNTFDIGKRNVLAVRKYLWKVGLLLTAEDVGGTMSRTVTLTISDGKVTVSSGSEKWTL